MGRSVSRPSNAAVTTYTTFEVENGDDANDDFQFAVSDMRDALNAAFPSVTSDDRWLGNEDHVIASNRHAYFGVSEYMGLVCWWIVPIDDSPLASQWIAQIESRFEKIVADNWPGTPLRRLGTFSNGEAIFERVDHG